MKILHITSSYWPAFEMGGPIESVHQLNKWLVKKGAEVTVYTTNACLKNRKDIVLKKENNLDRVRIFYFPYYGYIHFTFSPALFWLLKKNIKNFDLIHITGVWNFPVFAAAFWARIYKKPYIISPRGSLMKEPLEKKSPLKKKIFLKFFIKKYLQNATAIHFTAEAEKEEYVKAGLPLKKAIVIPNGLDLNSIFRHPTSPNYGNIQMSDVQKLSFKEKFNIDKNKKIILFLSRLSWKKGLDTLIPAFAEVVKKESKVVLVIIGGDDEGYKKNVEFLISNFKLKDKIIFTGMLTGDDKIAAYRESNVFVLPSYSENFGMAVVEAMVAKLPVVITKGVGISVEVEAAGAGLVVEKEVNQVSEAILKILNNPDLAKKMAKIARKLVESEFSSEKVAEKFIKEYNAILHKFKNI